jgi:hypothetical protein
VSAFFEEIDFPKKDFTSFDGVTKETIHEAPASKYPRAGAGAEVRVFPRN